MPTRDEKIKKLYQLLTALETEEDCRTLMEDLCTDKEIEKMAERVWAAQLLLEGKTYQQVMQQIPSEREHPLCSDILFLLQ